LAARVVMDMNGSGLLPCGALDLGSLESKFAV
jgi:hypothetical protein